MTLPENQRTNSRSMTGGTRVRSSAPAEVNWRRAIMYCLDQLTTDEFPPLAGM
jgi:hypothetical protein